MFISTLFIIAKNYKEFKCLSTENGYIKFGISTQWNIIHLYEDTKY